MNKLTTIIAIDPSGNWNKSEKGGTGLALLTSDGNIQAKTIWAKNYTSKEEYYKAITHLIHPNEIFDTPGLVVIEDFRLQFAKAGAMSNAQLQTSELIGRIELFCDNNNIKHVRQQNTVKSRWKDPLLKRELLEVFGYDMSKVSRHAKDALRHLVHAHFFTRHKVLDDEGDVCA